ncbi:endonuclease/exonuclease/phosphatase family protein [Marivirga sp.]|uniref:endonuclease/exonuclease/phosphatase family protein n=1 Tax=Marivirga sp. TaxID=2018662 RepID=UPI002D7F49F9|nr:endonuclease/exonuclease/phosphatase family protein [Marivirga sp.]HET8861236.1 endonuclease/exonuclease/phosphatase family protein [Marivirga sp.]
MKNPFGFILLIILAFSCKPTDRSFLTEAQVYPEDYKAMTSDTFRVMTWNVEHFVDLYDNPYVNNKRENNPDSIVFQEKIKLFAKALKKADADVVVLQEIEHIQLAKKLSEDLFPELNYSFFADAASINWYQNVVVMSRLPLGVLYSYGSVHSPVTFTDKEGEEQYETQSKINTRLWTIEVIADKDYNFYLTGAHLKAGRGKRDESMRLGQISLLKEQYARIYKEHNTANIVVAGDLNSYPDSQEIQSFKEKVEGISFIDPLPAEVMTHTADDPKRRLDYLLVNDNMAPELIKGSVKVPTLLTIKEMRKVSDHLPVIADFIASEKK